MDVDKVKIQDIFEQTVQYIIPLFQRHYVWDKEGQWIPLWENIETQATKRKNEIERSKLSHFTGAIVIQQKPSNINEINAYEIIDGQQRLTTFQLIFCAIRDVCRKLDNGFMTVANEAESYMFNQGRKVSEETRFKLKPTQYDRPALKDIFDNNFFQKGNLHDAYNYFKGKIEIFIENDIEKANRILDTVIEDFNLVQIRIDSDDEPEMIFESLNARGKKLLAFDLMRNNLFLRTRKEHKEDRDPLYRQFWQHFESKEWDKVTGSGHHRTALTELFLQHFLMAKLGTDKVGPSLFNTYQRQYQTKLSEDTTVKNELEEFYKYSNIYQDIIGLNGESDISNVYDNNIFDASLRPFFLYLIAEEKLPHEQLKYVSHALESYIMRRSVIVGTDKRPYANFFSELIAKLRKNRFSILNFITILKEEYVQSNKWPRDNDFSDFDGVTKDKAKKYILYRIECYHRKHFSEDQLSYNNKLTLEHIMPQSWKPHWLLPSSDGPVKWDNVISTEYKSSNRAWWYSIPSEKLDVALANSAYRESYHIARERDAYLHKIGNLTLLIRPLNAAQSNKPFSEKKNLMDKHSTLLLNRELCKKDNWDIAEIKSRSKELHKIFCQIWPDADWFLNNIPRD